VNNIVSEINKFFLEQGFEPITINDETSFRYKDNYYYRVSFGGETSYFIEYAETLEEAENNIYWDIGAYSSDSGVNPLITAIKSDILRYIVEEYQENGETERGFDKMLKIVI